MCSGVMNHSLKYQVPIPVSWERVYALEEVEQLAKEVLRWSSGIRLWMLEGPMGAGKTTFVRSVCAALGIQDPVSSPTFGIIQEYQTNQGEAVFHIDGYRLENGHQIDSLGIDSVLGGHQLCFVEWPSLFIEYVQVNYIRLEWVILERDQRILKLNYVVHE